MADNWKTLRVPKAAWETAKEQKVAAGRTWGEQIVRPDGDNASTDTAEVVEELKQEVEHLANSGAVFDEEAERIIGRIEDLESQLPKKIAEELRQ